MHVECLHDLHPAACCCPIVINSHRNQCLAYTDMMRTRTLKMMRKTSEMDDSTVRIGWPQLWSASTPEKGRNSAR